MSYFWTFFILSIWQAVYSYLDRLLSRVICGNLVITNDNLVQNVVQTCQFVLTIEYNQPTQNTTVHPFYAYQKSMFYKLSCILKLQKALDQKVLHLTGLTH